MSDWISVEDRAMEKINTKLLNNPTLRNKDYSIKS